MNLSTFRKIASLSIVVALIGAVGLFNPATATAATRYITTTGNGTVSVVPDAVKISATISDFDADWVQIKANPAATAKIAIAIRGEETREILISSKCDSSLRC